MNLANNMYNLVWPFWKQYRQTPVLGQGLGVDFTFAWDNNNNANNNDITNDNDNDRNNPLYL